MEMAGSQNYSGNTTLLSKYSDIIMPAAVVSILGIMIMPLPPFLLDILLSFNITCSIIILLVGMYILEPLELSSFPSILLLVTLFRLAMNIGSTRLILLHGHEGTSAAGQVISSFGNFVVGGSYVVGIIVFLILVLINYMVIVKGSGRIAEVAARFTLDAMPGKQMSIDADLNSGLISEDEARQKRITIAKESEYYGAMDGASKFVKGDAIAGIIITLVNIIGGLIIGVSQKGMSFSDAAQTYTILTIGDGLVTQIPALIISTTAGLIVSRAASQLSLGRAVSSQILSQPRAIGFASFVLFGFGLVPGLPTVPFLFMAIVTGIVSLLIFQSGRENLEKEKKEEVQKEKLRPPEKLKPLPPVDILSIEVGYGLIPLVDVEQGGELLERIRSVRKQVAQDIGIIVPSIHIQDNMQLKPGEYKMDLKGNEIAKGELMTNYYLAMNPGVVDNEIEGVATTEPTFGLPAVWIKNEVRERAIAEGYTVVDGATVLTTHISDIIRRYADELLGRQEVQQLLDNIKHTHPKVIEELIPNIVSLGTVVRCLQNLLRESIPIRDLLGILEAMADYGVITKDPDILTEYIRQRLARTITAQYQLPDGSMNVITIDQELEQNISSSIQQTEHGSYLAMEPGIVQNMMEKIAGKVEKFTELNQQPIILCSPQNRMHLKKLTDRFLRDVAVLSYDEITHNVNIQTLGTVRLSNAD